MLKVYYDSCVDTTIETTFKLCCYADVAVETYAPTLPEMIGSSKSTAARV